MNLVLMIVQLNYCYGIYPVFFANIQCRAGLFDKEFTCLYTIYLGIFAGNLASS